jgi:hypothetical protein
MTLDRSRRVGQKNDLARRRTKALQGADRRRKGSLAVVQAAPEVAEDGVIAAGKVGKRADDLGHSGALSDAKLAVNWFPGYACVWLPSVRAQSGRKGAQRRFRASAPG